ncbi:hypothetical protein IWW37_003701 [Coemansia sp. RSA 2050]|nr:hypothetical protein IWW37_003701 [Coemansia sp. RSA 2050]
MQLSRCHSAHECAQQFPDIGPVLATLAQSRVVVGSSELCQAVVSTSMEYSKALCQTAYANHRASVWFSQIVKSLLDSASGADTHHTYTLQGHEVVSDELAAKKLCVQRLAALAGVPGIGCDDRRKEMWAKAFSICSRSGKIELVGSIIPSLDACGWIQLGQHELVEQHGAQLLEVLPIELALMVWQRVEKARALLVVHLLRETAGTVRIVRAVLADDALCRQMELEIAQLILATRDVRLAELWRRLCHNNADSIRTRNQAEGGLVLGELFGGPGAHQPGVLERQWACVVEARRQASMEEVLGTWMRIVAAADDDYVWLLLRQHFGRPGASGLTHQQVRACSLCGCATW